MSNPGATARRDQLLTELGAAGRVLSTAIVLFHTNLAARLGLGATEVKVLELVARHVTLSPKQLREHTGLAAASVTGIVDRLEAKGFVERRRSPDDGRGVQISHLPRHTEVVSELFAGLVTDLDALYARYDTRELETVLDYLQRVGELQQRAALDLADPHQGGSGEGPGKQDVR